MLSKWFLWKSPLGLKDFFFLSLFRDLTGKKVLSQQQTVMSNNGKERNHWILE